MTDFDYTLAFSRNIGILTQQQQEQIKKIKISLAGMGGVGGDYLITFV